MSAGGARRGTCDINVGGCGIARCGVPVGFVGEARCMLDRDGGGELAAHWARVRGRLRTECGETVYRSWLRSLTLVRCDGDTVVLSVPTPFVRDRVTTQYGDRLRALWADEESAVQAIEVVVSNGAVAAEGGSPAVRVTNDEDDDDRYAPRLAAS